MLQADGRTARELNLSVGQVVITAGSNQFLYLLGDILLDPGDVVLCGRRRTLSIWALWRISGLGQWGSRRTPTA